MQFIAYFSLSRWVEWFAHNFDLTIIENVNMCEPLTYLSKLFKMIDIILERLKCLWDYYENAQCAIYRIAMNWIKWRFYTRNRFLHQKLFSTPEIVFWFHFFDKPTDSLFFPLFPLTGLTNAFCASFAITTQTHRPNTDIRASYNTYSQLLYA